MFKKVLCFIVVSILLINTFCIDIFAKDGTAYSVKNIKMTYKDTGEYAFAIVAGKTIKITADIVKNISESGSIYLACGLYNNENKMIGLVKSNVATLKTGESKSMYVEYKLPSGVNSQDNYLKVFAMSEGNKKIIFSCMDGSSDRLPEEKTVIEETTHITVHKEKRQTLKGVGVSYMTGMREGMSRMRYNEAYELLHTKKGTNFNVVRLWADLHPISIGYNSSDNSVKFMDGIKTFKSAYIDSGLIEDLKRITNNKVKFIITPATALPAEFREHSTQNVVLSPECATHMRNISVKGKMFTDIKNDGSVIFENINAKQTYTTISVEVASEYGGKILISNAENGKILSDVEIKPTGDNKQLKNIIVPKKTSLNGVKKIKLTFVSNGELFGSVGKIYIDGNQNIKTSKIADYAELMANYVYKLKYVHNVNIDYVTMFNEPLFHFTPSQLRMTVKEMRKKLDAKGLENVKIIADEWAEIDEFTLYAWEELLKDKEALEAIDGLSFHSYQTHGIDYFEQVKKIFEASGKEIWMTESSDTEKFSTLKNGDLIQGSEQAARMLNDLNNGVEYWMQFFGLKNMYPVQSGGDATSIIAVTRRDREYISTNKCYDYYKHIMDTFDYGSVFRHSTSTEYGDMSRPRGKKPPVNVAFAQRSDGKYALAVVNSSYERYISEAWAKQNDNPFSIIENVEIFIEELANVKGTEFDVYRSGKDGIYVYENTVKAVNGRLSLQLKDTDLLTLVSK